jgi:uncharacterized protein YbaA (DUF1428 family)
MKKNPPSTYVDGFVLCLPKTKLKAYAKVAAAAGAIWREHGALEYRECAADDMRAPGLTPFPQMAGAKRGEVVVFSWAVFKNRRARDAANKKIMADERLQAICSQNLFDYTRMAYGGFKVIVAA